MQTNQTIAKTVEPENAVKIFMKQHSLEQYTQALLTFGYDDLVVLKAMPKVELQNVAKLVKMKPGHAAKFVWALNEAKKAKTTAEAKNNEKTVPDAKRIRLSEPNQRGNFFQRLFKFSGKMFSTKGNATGEAAPAAPAAAAEVKTEAKTSKTTSGDGSAYVAMVVDRSGSMNSMGCEVMNGFNSFLKEQKALPGKCTATVVRFDSTVEVLQHGVSIQEVLEADRTTFAPRGMTALLDAIGQTIRMVEHKVQSMAQKPDKIMVMILTDGAENTSKEFSRKAVMTTIKRLEETGDWEFVFVGANQDAIAVGASYGMKAKNCLSYGSTPMYQNETFKCMSTNVTAYRSASKSSYSGFTPAQRSCTK